MKMISTPIRILAIVTIGLSAIVHAQTETGIGDFTYETRSESRCATASGTTAACSNIAPSTNDMVFYRDSALVGSTQPRTSTEGTFCGNGICDANESPGSCSSDCGGNDPTGTGPQIGTGACSSQRFIKTYPIQNLSTAGTNGTGLCYLDRATGTGSFAMKKLFTPETGFIATSKCGNGLAPRASLTLVCANGSWLEDKVTCSC